MRIDQLFDVVYGNKYDFNKMTPDPNGVCFVGRSGSRQGVSGRVRLVEGVTPYRAGLLTVALGGASRLATFVQAEPFYTAQNVAVLTPRTEMTLPQKLYWATCIRANRFRYEGFGREANRTLRQLELPDEAQQPVATGPVLDRVIASIPAISADEMPAGKSGATVGDLFDVRYGHSLELNALKTVRRPDGVNFVSRTDLYNGVSARVEPPTDMEPGVAGELTVALGGSPLATFLQSESCGCGRDVAILAAKEAMTDAEKLYWAMCIKANRYRFSYGRQANRTLSSLRLPDLPAGIAASGRVDDVLSGIKESLEASERQMASEEMTATA